MPEDEPAVEETDGSLPEASGDSPASPPRPSRWRPVLLVAVTLLVVAAAFGFWTLRGPDRHEDGQGELAMSGDGQTGGSISDFAEARDTQTETFGLPLCHLRGDTPVLESVTATGTVGDGFRVVGTGVRIFVPTPSDTPIFSVDGWPPNPSVVPDAIAPVAGYAVTNPCGSAPANLPYTELLIGMQRTSPAGGAWVGFEIAYTVGGRHRTLHSTWSYGICGTAVPCGPGPSASAQP